MSTKRSFEEVDSTGRHQTSPSAANSDNGGPLKKQKFDAKHKHKAKEGSIEYAKKRARGIERLLNKNQDLPANVRNDLERELAAHQGTIADKTHQKKRSATISKYHMVRFFERKKAMRLAKQLRRKLEKTTDADADTELEQLERDLHIADVDEMYTQYFPHAEPYISLYGSKSDATGQNDKEEGDKDLAAKLLLRTERPPMWSVVEKAMEEGPEALRRLRERRSPDNTQNKRRPERRPQQKAPKPVPTAKEIRQKDQQRQQAAVDKKGQPLNRRERRRLMRQAAAPVVEEDSDGGGFFEDD